jgi:hypothetical protein
MAIIGSLILSALVGAVIPFEEGLRSAWPYALGYGVLLSFASVGLARLGLRGLLWLGIAAAVALAPGVIGFVLALQGVESSSTWLQVSLYLFYALAGWGVGLVARGWWLYFRRRMKPPE